MPEPLKKLTCPNCKKSHPDTTFEVNEDVTSSRRLNMDDEDGSAWLEDPIYSDSDDATLTCRHCGHDFEMPQWLADILEW